MKRVLIAAFVVLVLVSCGRTKTTTTSATITEIFDNVTIENPEGNITVVSTTEKSVNVSAELMSEQSRLVHNLNVHGTLTIAVRCTGEPCSGNLDVALPDALYNNLTVLSGEGVVNISGQNVDSAVVDNGSGNIVYANSQGLDVTLRTAVGDIRGSGLAVTDLASVITEEGDYNLSYAVAPTTVNLYTPNGDITLNVPTGEYQISAESSGGVVSIAGVTATLDAQSDIRCRTGSGRIVIRGK